MLLKEVIQVMSGHHKASQFNIELPMPGNDVVREIILFKSRSVLLDVVDVQVSAAVEAVGDASKINQHEKTKDEDDDKNSTNDNLDVNEKCL